MSSQGTSANLSGASHGPATHTGDGNPTMANANTSNASATTGSTGQAGGDLAKDAQAPFKAVNDIGESIRTNINSFADNLLGGKRESTGFSGDAKSVGNAGTGAGR